MHVTVYMYKLLHLYDFKFKTNMCRGVFCLYTILKKRHRQKIQIIAPYQSQFLFSILVRDKKKIYIK